MKGTLITFGLLFLTINLTAQKLEKPNIDKISGDTIWRTSSEKIFAKVSFSGTVGEQLYVSAVKVKDTYFLFFSIQTGKISIFSIDEGQKIYIKLKNDNLVTLTNIKSKVSKYSNESYGSNSTGYYQITNEEMDKLISENVQFIRIEYSAGTFEYDIKDKFSEKIKNDVLLIKQK